MKKAGIALLGLLFLVLLLQFDYGSFWESMGQVPLLAFLGLLLLQVFTQLLLNYQWCRIGRAMGGSAGFMKMLYVNARGSIIECVTPGVKIGGEVTRALLLKKELGYSSAEAAALVAIQKMISLSVFFLINLVAVIHISSRIPFLQGTGIAVLVYVFLILVMGLFVGIFFGGEKIKQKIQRWNPTKRYAQRMLRFLSSLLTHIQALRTIKGELLKQLLLSLAIWILFPLKIVLLVGLFTSNYDVVYLTEVTFVSYMVGMIPLLPGGLGSFEAVMTGLLLLMNLSAGEAAAITILFRFNTFWFVIILSLCFVAIRKLRGERACVLK